MLVSLGRPDQRARRLAEAQAAARAAGFGLVVAEPPAAISADDDHEAAAERIARAVAAELARLRPAVVVSPSPHDIHHGHETVGRAVRTVLEGAGARPAWWMWGLWGDLPRPNVYVPFAEPVLARQADALRAYAGEISRNDYVTMISARARANAVLGSERVFGFGAPAASRLALAELLTDARYDGRRWTGTPPRVFDAEAPLALPGGRGRLLDPWLDAPSASSLAPPLAD